MERGVDPCEQTGLATARCARAVANRRQVYLRLWFITSPPGEVQSSAVTACLCVCLPARVSRKPRVQISRHFPYLLTVAVARSCSDHSVIRYVLPVFVDGVIFSHNRAHVLCGVAYG